MNWDTYFLNLADAVALKSKDQSTQIGAVIVGEDNEILSTGYNSFPRGINDDLPERQLRPEKYFWFEHAERNAIFNAARHGVRLKGSRIFLNCNVICSRCSRAVINTGIVEVIYGSKNIRTEKWDEESKRSTQMLREAGVLIR